MKLITLLVMSLFFSTTINAEIIDVDQVSKSKLSNILEDIDIKFKISHSGIKKEHEPNLRLHISKYFEVIFMPGNWETHTSCDLVKNNDHYECTIKNVDMANFTRTLMTKHYQFSVHVPYGKKYCNDIDYYKDDLKIEKEGVFFPNYTLLVEMDECSFTK
ncbi:MAG: hypothetical protein CME64_08645 [Halobacteriovoraceae bacterium]|nr:hypothetical protein [Halobacteriovoraceae bacterium]